MEKAAGGTGRIYKDRATTLKELQGQQDGPSAHQRAPS